MKMLKVRPTRLRFNRKHRAERNSAAIDRLARIVGFASLVISIPLATKSLYDTFRTKTDELSIQVASYEPEGKYVDIGIIYSNTGDFTEIIDGVTSLIGQTDHSTKSILPLEQGRCLKPISVKPGEVIMARYRVFFDTNDTRMMELPEFEQNNLLAMLDFDIVRRTQGVLHQQIVIGSLSPWHSGPFLGDVNYQFETVAFPVEFAKSAPRITVGTYPVSPELSIPNSCDN